MSLQQTWNLDSVFPGGADSAELSSFLEALQQDIQQLDQEVKGAKVPASLDEVSATQNIIELYGSCFARIREASAFVSCLTAQNVNDKKASQISGRVMSLSAVLQSVKTQFDNLLRGMNDELWADWIKSEKVAEYNFVLNESRDQAKEKMSPELESLALALGVDGYHGWSDMYDTIVSKIKIPYEENGKTEMLSAGQAFNKLHDPRREVRQELFEKWENAWSASADYCADTLNHLSGFRLKLYEKRGWDDVLKEPLAIGRMTKETLDTMWGLFRIRSRCWLSI